MSREYRPIDCSLHDRLESAATLRKSVAITYRNGGETTEADVLIEDVFTRDGAEFVRLADGREIRLDDLQSVDGHPN